MDERKKTIKQLEEEKEKVQESINGILIQLGEILLARLNNQESFSLSADPSGTSASLDTQPFQETALPPTELAEYRRLIKDIADSQTHILKIETNMLRLRELEERITKKEQQHAEQMKDLSDSYAVLGELVLDTPEYADFGVSYRRQIEVLIPKIRSLENRLEELEDKNDAGVLFNWIGKGAQGMVLRSFLGNSQESLRRLYGTAGEQFILANTECSGNQEIFALLEDIRDTQKGSAQCIEEVSALKAEYRKISDIVSIERSPVKHIQDMENHIAHILGKLKLLYLSIGRQATEAASADRFDSLVQQEDRLILDQVKTLQRTVGNQEQEIEKLRASLAVDDENAEIEKLKKTIEHHRRRIAASTIAIADIEKRINDANQHIDALRLSLR